MAKLGDPLKTSEDTRPPANEVVQKFLDDAGIELKLSPLAQSFEDGAIVIRPQQILVSYKQPKN